MQQSNYNKYTDLNMKSKSDSIITKLPVLIDNIIIKVKNVVILH